MSGKIIIRTADAPPPIGPYNQAILAGETLYISGQICINPQTGDLENKDVQQETKRCMTNLDAILKAAGMTFSNVVKTTIFITDMKRFAEINEVMRLLGRETEWVPDVCGMLTTRVVCMIINEAFFTLSEKISTEQEIDTALKLGTNYPWGPFEWCKLLGVRNVYTLLKKLATEHPRYQPAALLQQRALAQ